MKITALIPARKNSIRFPGKNYANFLGKPLFMHSVDFAKQSECIKDYYVTTNDEYIIDKCQTQDIPYICRPNEYSQSKSTNTCYVRHFLNKLVAEQVELPGAILVLQPTDPIRKNNYLSEMIELFKNKKADCVFTVVKCKAKIGRINKGLFDPFNYKFEQRFQDMDSYYEELGMFYLLNVKSFLKYDSFFGVRNIPYEVPEFYKNMDIDTKIELEMAELIYKKHENFNKNLITMV